MKRKTGFTTSILHADRESVIEHGSLHKPLHLSVAYGYRDARELANVFQGKAQGYAYGRQGNPTAAALEEKVNRMEDGIGTVCFGTGMAAIGAIMLALLRDGDHVVATAFSTRLRRTATRLLSSMQPTAPWSRQASGLKRG